MSEIINTLIDQVDKIDEVLKTLDYVKDLDTVEKLTKKKMELIDRVITMNKDADTFDLEEKKIAISRQENELNYKARILGSIIEAGTNAVVSGCNMVGSFVKLDEAKKLTYVTMGVEKDSIIPYQKSFNMAANEFKSIK